MSTPNYNFTEIDPTMTADVSRDLNRLAKEVDEALKQVENKVPSEASTGGAGVVKLNDTVNSTSKTEAATANAVRVAYERASLALQSAADGKALVAAATTDMGVPTSNNATFAQIANNIRSINTGKRSKTGSGVATSSFSISDLPFKPSFVIVKKGDATNKVVPYEFHLFYQPWNLGAFRSHWATDQYIESATSRITTTNNGFQVNFWNGFSGSVEWVAVE